MSEPSFDTSLGRDCTAAILIDEERGECLEEVDLWRRKGVAGVARLN